MRVHSGQPIITLANLPLDFYRFKWLQIALEGEHDRDEDDGSAECDQSDKAGSAQGRFPHERDQCSN